jgi:hypothetical protein
MTLFSFPSHAHVQPESRIEGTALQRYEDIAQDGRLVLLGMPHALGRVVWSHLIDSHSATRHLRSQGIVAIMTRLLLRGTDATVGVTEQLDADGAYELSHSRRTSGEVNKLHLNIWLDLKNSSTKILGSVFAEHVFTRAFEEPAKRGVREFDSEHLPRVPSPVYQFDAPHSAMALPAGASWIDNEFSNCKTSVFGLDHTDSNRHVHSLVYPRLFIDAALSHLYQRQKSTAVLARDLEVSFRKPSFAGQGLDIWVRAFELGGELGATGYFAPSNLEDQDRAHCFLRVLFR